MKGFSFMSRLVLVFALFLIASCAQPRVAPPPRAHIPPEHLPRIGTPPAPRERDLRPAVVDTLIARAEKQWAMNLPEAAFQTLERALAVDGKDPMIWHLMAGIRLAQGEFAQARSLASKSNTLAAPDDPLQKKNLEIIRRASGK